MTNTKQAVDTSSVLSNDSEGLSCSNFFLYKSLYCLQRTPVEGGKNQI